MGVGPGADGPGEEERKNRRLPSYGPGGNGSGEFSRNKDK